MKKLMFTLMAAVFFIVPFVFAQESEHAVPGDGMTQSGPIDAGNKFCPVSGEEINGSMMKATYEYEGKIYNFCCAGCIDEFKKDPEKYIEVIEKDKGEK